MNRQFLILVGVFAGLARAAGASSGAPESVEGKPGLLDVRLAESAWIVGIFLVLVLVLYFTAWKNVLRSLKERETRIRGDLEAAQRSREAAELAARQAREQVAEADARARAASAQAAEAARRYTAQAQEEAQVEISRMRTQALAEIDAAVAAAKAGLKDEVAKVSSDMVAKLLPRELTPADRAGLMNRAIKELSGVS